MEDIKIKLLLKAIDGTISFIEFVENGKTGYITQFNCKDEFINKVLFLIENPENIDQLKSGAKNKSREYSAEKAWDLLRKIIYLN